MNQLYRSRKRLLQIGLACSFVLFLISCLNLAGSENKVYIRIHNKSAFDIRKVETGAGRQNGATGSLTWRRIIAGSISDYERSDPIPANYRSGSVDFYEGKNRINFRGLELDIPELEAGYYYTYEIDIIGDEAIIEVVEERSP